MDGRTVDEITAHFQALSAVVPLHPIRTEGEYEKAVRVLNQLLDAGAADEAHSLADLAATLGEIVGEYEQSRYPNAEVSPATMLRFLVEQHPLTQSDLPEVGTQGVVSEVLRGIRELNVRQIKAVSARFKVSPAALF
ncbi:MAG: transcriptional regulator [Burkholderiaceae bacterium]